MVKTVVGEETRLQLAEDRLAQSAIPAQVHVFSIFLSPLKFSKLGNQVE